MRRTGWVWDERFARHDTRAWSVPWQQPTDHPENPETKRRFANLVRLSGLEQQLVPLPIRAATRDEVEQVHTPRYVEDILQRSEREWGDAGDGETPFGPGSGAVAMLAAGSVMNTFDAVLAGEVDNAYALVRPPGHHAVSDAGMGYCIFHNIAVGIRHIQRRRGVARVAVVDWDVHHGNGTETLFYDDPSVLTISMHQDNLYPVGRGGHEDNGSGDGTGANLNVPLPSASGQGAYLAAMDRVVVPALRRFQPELIVLASGLDSAAMDPLGRQLLHSRAYRALTHRLLDVAADVCGSRVAAVHEGGYDPLMSPFCGLAIVEALSGRSTDVDDPWTDSIAELPEQQLLPHHDAAVTRAEELVQRVPEHGRDVIR